MILCMHCPMQRILSWWHILKEQQWDPEELSLPHAARVYKVSIFLLYSKQSRHFTQTPLGGFLPVVPHCDLTLCITCNLFFQCSIFLTLTEKSLMSVHQLLPVGTFCTQFLYVHPAWLSYITWGHKYNISVPRLVFWWPVFRFGDFS